MLSGAIAASAQVKIGSNPTTITPNANLDVEGVSNRHTVVMQSGRVGVGTANPATTLHVQAVEDLDLPFARNLIARFDPFGGAVIDSAAAIGVSGGRALFGYDIASSQSKYAFVRGNQNTEIRLQVVDQNSVMYPNALVVSGRPGSHGFVGINNEAPQSQLDVRGTTKVIASSVAQTGIIWNGTSNVSGFEVSTNPATGDVVVGIQRAGAFSPLHISKPAGTTTGEMVNFAVGGVGRGTITHTAAGIQYNTTSDQRLKENIHRSKFGLETLKGVKIYDYNFKSDKSKALSTGVLAQELHKVYPQAVTVGGADAKTNPWQVDYSKLVPMLVKSVQELSAELEATNQKVASLKSEKAQMSAELNERVSKLERLLSADENAKSVSSASSLSGSVSK